MVEEGRGWPGEVELSKKLTPDIKELDEVTEGRWGLKLPKIDDERLPDPINFFNDLLRMNGYSTRKGKKYDHQLTLPAEGNQPQVTIIGTSSAHKGPRGRSDLFTGYSDTEYGIESYKILVPPQEEGKFDLVPVFSVTKPVVPGGGMYTGRSEMVIKHKGDYINFDERDPKTDNVKKMRAALREIKQMLVKPSAKK